MSLITHHTKCILALPRRSQLFYSTNTNQLRKPLKSPSKGPSTSNIKQSLSEVSLRDPSTWLPELPNEPYVVYSDKDIVVCYKPAGVHTVGNKNSDVPTLSSWLADKYPEVLKVKGRQEVDGGLLHRLDGSTSGLVLAARNQIAFDGLRDCPIRKAYLAFSTFDPTMKRGPDVPVWPLSVDSSPSRWHQKLREFSTSNNNKRISFDLISKFAPFGPKGARVKLVDVAEGTLSEIAREFENKDSTGFYHSHFELIDRKDERTLVTKVEILKGFRHQIRAHISYVGCPIIGDPLYQLSHHQNPVANLKATQTTDKVPIDPIGLYAVSLTFTHPTKGKETKISLKHADLDMYDI